MDISPSLQSRVKTINRHLNREIMIYQYVDLSVIANTSHKMTAYEMITPFKNNPPPPRVPKHPYPLRAFNYSLTLVRLVSIVVST